MGATVVLLKQETGSSQVRVKGTVLPVSASGTNQSGWKKMSYICDNNYSARGGRMGQWPRGP